MALLLQVAMAHAPVDEAPLPDGYSVSDEFFMYKFSKEQAGLSGLAFDEGIFSVFGYVTEVRPWCLAAPCLCYQRSSTISLIIKCCAVETKTQNRVHCGPGTNKTPRHHSRKSISTGYQILSQVLEGFTPDASYQKSDGDSHSVWESSKKAKEL